MTFPEKTSEAAEQSANPETEKVAPPAAAKPAAAGAQANSAAGAQDSVAQQPALRQQEQQDTETVDVTSSAPTTWQRVTGDAQYVDSSPYAPPTVAQVNLAHPQDGDSEAPTVAQLPKANYAASSSESPSVGLAGGLGVPRSAPAASGAERTTVNLAAAGASRAAGATPSALRRPGRGPRRAALQVKRVDPWSVLKLALVLSVALFFVWLVAVGALYGVLDGMGVWDKLNGTYNDLVQGGGDAGSGEPLISAGRVFGVAAIIGAVNIVLFTALATVGAFVYNVSADLAGGLEVTLSERE